MNRDELPEPDIGMSPREKGELLLAWARAGAAFSFPTGDGKLVRRDFSGACLDSLDLAHAKLIGVDLRGASLVRTRLDGANLSNADLTGASCWGASFEKATLDNVLLAEATLAGCVFKNASLANACLTGAELGGAHLVGTGLALADLQDTSLAEAWLLNCDLQGAEGLPRDRRAVHIDANTYARSRWTPAHLSEWLRAGAVIEDFDALPPTAQARVLSEREGLCLHFRSRLSEVDRLVIDALVVAFHGQFPDSDVHVVEFQINDESSLVRLRGSNPADLVFLAVWIYQRVWEQPATAAPAQLSFHHELGTLTSQRMLRQLSWLVSRGDVFELWEVTGGKLARTSEWRVSHTKEGALLDLLLVLFLDWNDLRAYLVRLPGGLELIPYLPGPTSPLSTLAVALIREADARGLIDRDFFLALVRLRPRRAAEIAVAAASWGILVPAALIA
jgi:hypothetical protein